MACLSGMRSEACRLQAVLGGTSVFKPGELTQASWFRFTTSCAGYPLHPPHFPANIDQCGPTFKLCPSVPASSLYDVPQSVKIDYVRFLHPLQIMLCFSPFMPQLSVTNMSWRASPEPGRTTRTHGIGSRSLIYANLARRQASGPRWNPFCRLRLNGDRRGDYLLARVAGGSTFWYSLSGPRLASGLPRPVRGLGCQGPMVNFDTSDPRCATTERPGLTCSSNPSTPAKAICNATLDKIEIRVYTPNNERATIFCRI
jgi:hypothetical protein